MSFSSSNFFTCATLSRSIIISNKIVKNCENCAYKNAEIFMTGQFIEGRRERGGGDSQFLLQLLSQMCWYKFKKISMHCSFIRNEIFFINSGNINSRQQWFIEVNSGSHTNQQWFLSIVELVFKAFKRGLNRPKHKKVKKQTLEGKEQGSKLAAVSRILQL